MTHPFRSEIACETSVPHPCAEFSFQCFKYRVLYYERKMYFLTGIIIWEHPSAPETRETTSSNEKFLYG